jgi:threonine synthase
VEFVNHPETIATAIRIGKPINWKKAIKAIRDSKGTAEVVSDDEILHAQRLLASKEGIFAEPASAASLAGLKKAVESGEIGVNDKVVCVATGCGLKDVEVIEKLYEKPVEVEPNLKDLMIAMGLTGEN